MKYMDYFSKKQAFFYQILKFYYSYIFILPFF